MMPEALAISAVATRFSYTASNRNARNAVRAFNTGGLMRSSTSGLVARVPVTRSDTSAPIRSDDVRPSRSRGAAGRSDVSSTPARTASSMSWFT